MRSPSGLAASEAIRGREAVWDFYIQNIGAWREGALENDELIEAGNDRIVGHVRGEMQGKASGASVAFSYWTVQATVT